MNFFKGKRILSKISPTNLKFTGFVHEKCGKLSPKFPWL